MFSLLKLTEGLSDNELISWLDEINKTTSSSNNIGIVKDLSLDWGLGIGEWGILLLH